MNTVELLFYNFQHTISAVAAFGTVGAVITALYLSRKSEAVRLKAFMSVWHMVEQGTTTSSSINVQVTNCGLRTAFLPAFCFFYKIPFTSYELAITPEHFQPLELSAGRNTLIKIHSAKVFHEEMEEAFRRVKYFRRLRIKRMKGYLVTEEGKKFRVKILKPFKEEAGKLLNKLDK